MVKTNMSLYDKLSLLESKIDTLLTEISEAQKAKSSLQGDYDDLFRRYILLEEEMRQIKKDRDLVRQRIESIIARIN